MAKGSGGFGRSHAGDLQGQPLDLGIGRSLHKMAGCSGHPSATATVVATTLDERVFCYMGLPEQIHTDQGAQFESQLMTELCQLWGVEKTRTTPYHPQANGMVKRNNRGIGDSLRAMLLRRGQDEWDILLPQLMRAYRGTPPYSHRRDG